MLRNGIYNVIPGLFRAGLGFISVPILIRLMGLEEYGVWSLVSSVLSLIVLAEAGLPVSATVFVSQDLAKKDDKGLSQTLTITIAAMFILATTASVLLCIGGEALASCFPKLEALQHQMVVQSIQVGAIAVWAQLLQQCFIGIEQAYQQYKFMSALATIQWIFLTTGWMVLAWSGGRSVMLAQWQSVVSVATLLGHIWIILLLTKKQNIRLLWNSQRGIEIVNYSLVSWITTLGRALFTRGDRLIVGSLLGSSKLAVYATMFDFASVTTSFSALAVQPLIPTISNLVLEKDSNKALLQNKVKQAIIINALVSIVIGSIILICGGLIIKFVIPESFNVTNVKIFKISVLITTLISLNAPGYFILFTTKDVAISAFNQLFFGALSLILIATGSLQFSLSGAVFGNLGYLGTLILPAVAMKKLNIPVHLLFSWLVIPVSLFLIISCFGIMFIY
ncbi:MAG: oligosaccharide flippase family protein [Dolichospermum sp. UKL201]|jgi:O-antigen/teichoic acid export membrane protein|nr:MAG: oligosaccharide flippase family protein [Dolichospermum sp. UKL201]